MKLLQLKYFDMVCRCESVTEAAEKLHVSQPSVSQAIRELEKEFSTALFVRKSNRLSLTEEGFIFCEKVREILSKSQELTDVMSELKKDGNQLELGIAPIVGSMLLPPLYQELKDYCPGLSLKVTEQNSLPLAGCLLRDNKPEVAILPLYRLDETQFEIHHILNLELMFCTSKLNPLSRQSKITVRDIADAPLVLMNDNAAETQLIRDMYQQAGIQPDILLQSDHLHTIDHFINHAIASSCLYKTTIHRGSDIVPIPFAKPLMVPIGLVWKKGRQLNPAAQKFLQFLQEVTFMYVYDNYKPVKERDNLIPTL